MITGLDIFSSTAGKARTIATARYYEIAKTVAERHQWQPVPRSRLAREMAEEYALQLGQRVNSETCAKWITKLIDLGLIETDRFQRARVKSRKVELRNVHFSYE